MFSRLIQPVFVCCCLLINFQQAQAASCSGQGVELQVLGSGGPEMQDKRASSSYLIWRNGKASVLVDTGGGSSLRFGQAGAQMADLDIVLFTHMHADHSADFPALIKSSYFEDRQRPLPVYGPPGNGRFPSVTEFIHALFNEKTGAYRYLSDYLPANKIAGEDSYAIQPHDVTLEPNEQKPVAEIDGTHIFATPVIHGSVPALAWRIEADGKSIVFSGDGNGNNGNLEKLAENADILVAHNAVPEGATGVERALHMPPSVIGRIAATARVKKLVLSHRMLRTLGKEPQTSNAINKQYKGPVSFADDLDCFSLSKN